MRLKVRGLFGLSSQGELYTPSGRLLWWLPSYLLPFQLAAKIHAWLNRYVSDAPVLWFAYHLVSKEGDLVFYGDDLWLVRRIEEDRGRRYLYLRHALNPLRVVSGRVEQRLVRQTSLLERLAYEASRDSTR